MDGPRQTMMRLLQRCFDRNGRDQRAEAVIRVASHAAVAELADGSQRAFLRSDHGEFAIEVAIRWARKQGAVTIRILR